MKHQLYSAVLPGKHYAVNNGNVEMLNASDLKQKIVK